MKRKPKIMDDPVVQEVRAWREKLWKEAGGTFAGLLAFLDRTLPQKPDKKQISRDPSNGRGPGEKRSPNKKKVSSTQ